MTQRKEIKEKEVKIWKKDYGGLNDGSLKGTSPQSLWMWLCLEKGSPQVKLGILRWDHPRLSKCPYKKRTHSCTKGEDDVTMEAEIRVMNPQAKDTEEFRQRRKLGERHGTLSLWASRRNQACQQLDLRVLDPQTVKENTSVVLGYLVCGNLLQQPWETKTKVRDEDRMGSSALYRIRFPEGGTGGPEDRQHHRG